MKRILFVMVAVAAVSFAQADTRLLVDSIVDFNAEGTPTQKDAFLYDITGNATMWHKYGKNNGEWATTQSYQLSYEYTNGRISRRNEKLSTSTGWILMNRTNYSYDDQGRISLESRESLSAVGNTWSVIAQMIYTYGEGDVIEKIDYKFGSAGEDYLSYVYVPESSSETIGVYAIYWTGFEEEGTDGQRKYYYSEHYVSSTQGVEAVTDDRLPVTEKILRNGEVLILRGDKTYDLMGGER